MIKQNRNCIKCIAKENKQLRKTWMIMPKRNCKKVIKKEKSF